MYFRLRILFLVALVIGFADVSLSCRAGSVSQTTPPKQITPADLAKLRWIEGSWRGTGEVQPPFFERYHFENESTMVMESLSDESLSKTNDVTRYELKDGRFGDGRSVATALDDNSITFQSLSNAQSSYRFQRESDNSWKATINVPASGNKPARQIIYLMARWPQKTVEPKPAP